MDIVFYFKSRIAVYFRLLLSCPDSRFPWPFKVRDWAEIAPDSATFKNAYKIRALREGETDTKPVPHSFIFAKRGSFLPSKNPELGGCFCFWFVTKNIKGGPKGCTEKVLTCLSLSPPLTKKNKVFQDKDVIFSCLRDYLEISGPKLRKVLEVISFALSNMKCLIKVLVRNRYLCGHRPSWTSPRISFGLPTLRRRCCIHNLRMSGRVTSRSSCLLWGGIFLPWVVQLHGMSRCWPAGRKWLQNPTQSSASWIMWLMKVRQSMIFDLLLRGQFWCRIVWRLCFTGVRIRTWGSRGKTWNIY